MTQISLNIQSVNLTGSGGINIVSGFFEASIFNETAGSVSLSNVLSTDTVTIGNFTYTYEYLGSGNVRGDTNQAAAFIRITSSLDGGPITAGDPFAISLTGVRLDQGNTQLRLNGLDKSTPTQFPGVPCFVAGTVIQTSMGEVKIEDLAVGDLVRTMDHRYQPIRWIGGRRLSRAELDANPKLNPVRISAGALGAGKPEVDLLVSPQHRLLVKSKIAERIFDNIEVLIPANKLIAIEGVDFEIDTTGVAYFHMLFEAHQIVFANGAPTESLFTGPEALKSVSAEARMEIETLFPEIITHDFVPVSARHIPKSGKQMKMLVERHKKNNKPLLTDIA